MRQSLIPKISPSAFIGKIASRVEHLNKTIGYGKVLDEELDVNFDHIWTVSFDAHTNDPVVKQLKESRTRSSFLLSLEWKLRNLELRMLGYAPKQDEDLSPYEVIRRYTVVQSLGLHVLSRPKSEGLKGIAFLNGHTLPEGVRQIKKQTITRQIGELRKRYAFDVIRERCYKWLVENHNIKVETESLARLIEARTHLVSAILYRIYHYPLGYDNLLLLGKVGDLTTQGLTEEEHRTLINL